MNSALQSINQGLLASLPALTLMTALPAIAQTTITPLPPTATVDGKTQAELSTEWWQFTLGLPAEQNPVLDPTGANANFGQSGSVLFLFGSFFGEPVNRQITVKTNQYLFFPLLNAAYISFPGNPPLTEAKLRNLVTFSVSNLKASVNGQEITDLLNYQQSSPLFTLNFPENNIFGLPAGTYNPSVSNGYWLLLPPLRSGNYEITFGGSGYFNGFLSQQNNTYQVQAVQAVPEPTAILGLLTASVVGLVTRKRRQFDIK